jgi:subtilase family serine protease
MRGLRAATWVGLPAAVALAGGLLVSASVGGLRGPGRQHASQQFVKKHGTTTRLLSERQCLATRSIRIPCYDPAQVENAYDVQPLFERGVNGAGQTIAIVTSFGSPTVASDLATFDDRFDIPAPPSFRVIQPAGPVPPYDGSTTTMVGWAGEATLDVEWAHAMAPGASILLVETPVSETEGTVGFPQIVSAETYVIDHGLADVISQSFGANEQTFTSLQSVQSLREAFEDAAAKGVTVVAASGDTGASDALTASGRTYSTTPTVTWPASDPLVTAVGGTELSLDAAGARTRPDRAWNDTDSKVVNEFVFGTTSPHPDATGGGLSSFFSRPSYQDGVSGTVGDRRGVPDISMSAACSGLVDTYQSFRGPTPPGWYYVCGTSEAAPLFAGIVALADQEAGHPLGIIDPALYAMAARHDRGIVAVHAGGNTVSFSQGGTTHTVDGYEADGSYNLATGLGTVDAAYFVPELVRAVATVGHGVTYGFVVSGPAGGSTTTSTTTGAPPAADARGGAAG